MKKTVLAVLVATGTLWAGPNILLKANCGLSVSYLSAQLPEQMYVDNRSATVDPLLGVGIDLLVNDYFRVGTGVFQESRGSTFEGYWREMLWGLVPVQFTGEMCFSYRFLQIPLRLEGVLPLLLPGNVHITAAGELGVLLDAQQNYASDTSDTKGGVNIDDQTSGADFGLSIGAGFELPIGSHSGICFDAAYYFGFVDMYEALQPADPEYDLTTRAVRVSFSFFTAILSELR